MDLNHLIPVGDIQELRVNTIQPGGFIITNSKYHRSHLYWMIQTPSEHSNYAPSLTHTLLAFH